MVIVANEQPRPERRIYRATATPQDFATVDIGDWIEGVGDITTYFERVFVRRFGDALCASHSSQQEQPEPIASTEPLHRLACKYQNLVVYPTDEYVHCKSKEKCEFQTSSSIDNMIYCDKPIVSYDTAIRNRVITDILAMIRIREKCSDNPNGWLWKQDVLVKAIESLRGAP